MNENKGLNIAGIIALVLLIAGFGAFYIWDKREQAAEMASFRQQEKEDNLKEYARIKAVSEYLESAEKSVSNDMKGIVILGDSYVSSNDNLSFYSNLSNQIEKELFYDINLEASYSASLAKYKLSIPVENHSSKNESFDTIMTRLGIKPLYLADDVVIPAHRDFVQLSFMTEGNKEVKYTPQANDKLGESVIDDIRGTMHSETKQNGVVYYFKRETAGEEKNVKAGAKIQITGSEFSDKYIPVIFFGNNDYEDADDYIKAVKAVINRQKKCGDRFVVIGRTDEGSETDKKLKSQFGDNYIRVDNVSVSELDKKQLADDVFKKMDSLGYFTSVRETVKATAHKITDFDNEHNIH